MQPPLWLFWLVNNRPEPSLACAMATTLVSWLATSCKSMVGAASTAHHAGNIANAIRRIAVNRPIRTNNSRATRPVKLASLDVGDRLLRRLARRTERVACERHVFQFARRH